MLTDQALSVHPDFCPNAADSQAMPPCNILHFVPPCRHGHMLCAVPDSEAIVKAERHGDSDDDIRELQERSTRALQGSRDVDNEASATGSKAGDAPRQVTADNSN